MWPPSPGAPGQWPAPPGGGWPPPGPGGWAEPTWGGGYGYAAPQTEPRAVWGLVLGILSLVCLGLLAGVPGIIVSASARRRIRSSQGRLGGAGMATAGLVLSIVGTVLSVAVLVIVAIAAAVHTSGSSTSTSAALLAG